MPPPGESVMCGVSLLGGVVTRVVLLGMGVVVCGVVVGGKTGVVGVVGVLLVAITVVVSGRVGDVSTVDDSAGTVVSCSVEVVVMVTEEMVLGGVDDG